jgi:hypothetical protein
LKDASLFLGYKEIEGTIKAQPRTGLTVRRLSEALRSRARTTRLGLYTKTFGPNSTEAPPFEEFLCLLAMALDNQFADFVDEGRLALPEKLCLSSERLTCWLQCSSMLLD